MRLAGSFLLWVKSMEHLHLCVLCFLCIAERCGRTEKWYTMGMPLLLWPFGGRDPFESMMADMHRMRSDPNAEVFSSSFVMTYSSTGEMGVG